MKKPEWPGVSVAVLIVFTITIIVVADQHWNTDAVKGWQTLIAAGVALVAALIAWAAAWQKLKFDKLQASIEKRRKTLGVYYRTDLVLKDLRDVCVKALYRIDNSRGPFGPALRRDQLAISEPPEFELIWDNLDVFPRQLIQKMALIRRRIRIANRAIHVRDHTFIVEIDEQLKSQLSNLRDQCDAAVVALTPLISDLVAEA